MKHKLKRKGNKKKNLTKLLHTWFAQGIILVNYLIWHVANDFHALGMFFSLALKQISHVRA
jgi:hypothetical protein